MYKTASEFSGFFNASCHRDKFIYTDSFLTVKGKDLSPHMDFFSVRRNFGIRTYRSGTASPKLGNQDPLNFGCNPAVSMVKPGNRIFSLSACSCDNCNRTLIGRWAEEIRRKNFPFKLPAHAFKPRFSEQNAVIFPFFQLPEPCIDIAS